MYCISLIKMIKCVIMLFFRLSSHSSEVFTARRCLCSKSPRSFVGSPPCTAGDFSQEWMSFSCLAWATPALRLSAVGEQNHICLYSIDNCNTVDDVDAIHHSKMKWIMKLRSVTLKHVGGFLVDQHLQTYPPTDPCCFRTRFWERRNSSWITRSTNWRTTRLHQWWCLRLHRDSLGKRGWHF